MLAASGEFAWGAIALGQSIGAVAAVALGYGWGLFGPAAIAGKGASRRRLEYAESVTTRLALLTPVAAVAVLVAVVIAPSWKMFAGAGAVTMTTGGLTAAWYFVGVARPYAFFLLETLPRVVGTAAGIVLMRLGQSALIGIMAILGGIVIGFFISSWWIFSSTSREGAERLALRPVRELLATHRHGIASNLGLAAYGAAPMVIVAIAAPAIQPVIALAVKIVNLVNSGLLPAINVAQGWVPRASGTGRLGRARTTLRAALFASAAIGVGVVLVSEPLTRWLGNGKLTLSTGMVVAMACWIAIQFWKATFERAVLASFDKLEIITRSIVVSSIFGLPLVAVGAVVWGALGAIVATVIGLLLGVAVEWFDWVRYGRRPL